MTMDIDKVKFELLMSALEPNSTVDIGSWVERFPEHREELLDFWLWARPRNDPGDGIPPRSVDVSATSHDALQRACLAVSLGPEWLRAMVMEVEPRYIAQGIQELRTRRPLSTPPSKRAFRRAVVYAWVIEQLGTVRATVSRLGTQKATYLLECSLRLDLFDRHQKKPLGPYDHFARYKDAEPIAAKRRWIRILGSTLESGENVDEFHRYAPRYLRSVDLACKLTRLFARLADDQLETLATVHWVASRLPNPETDLTAEAIRKALEKDPQWSSKLGKVNFEESQVKAALATLLCLGLLGKI